GAEAAAARVEVSRCPWGSSASLLSSCHVTSRSAVGCSTRRTRARRRFAQYVSAQPADHTVTRLRPASGTARGFRRVRDIASESADDRCRVKVAEGEGFEPPRASRPGGFQVDMAGTADEPATPDDISSLAELALFGASEARWFLLGYLAGLGARW